MAPRRVKSVHTGRHARRFQPWPVSAAARASWDPRQSCQSTWHPWLAVTVETLGRRIEIPSPAPLRDFMSALAPDPGWQLPAERTNPQRTPVLTGFPIATAVVRRAGWANIGKEAGYVLLRVL